MLTAYVSRGFGGCCVWRSINTCEVKVSADEGGSFSPDDVTRLSATYEHTLELLELKDRTDPIITIIAKRSSTFSNRASPTQADFAAVQYKN